MSEPAPLVGPGPINNPSPPPPHRDPITCHILDQTTGLPAASVLVTLTLLRPSSPTVLFTARTSADGRIATWDAQAGPPLAEIFQKLHEGRMVWSLKFATGEYFGEGNTFFPEVEVKFFVEEKGGGHYHVPLLLGPWSYTTYRGS